MRFWCCRNRVCPAFGKKQPLSQQLCDKCHKRLSLSDKPFRRATRGSGRLGLKRSTSLRASSSPSKLLKHPISRHGLKPIGGSKEPSFKGSSKHSSEELKFMLWNVQDLGGGPSRGPRRDDDIIERIALVIAMARPDVCVLLEVKGFFQVGAEPKPPAVKKASTHLYSTRHRREEDEEPQEDEWAKYEKAHASWQKRKEEASRLDKGTPPGSQEFHRIVQMLEHMQPGEWSYFLPQEFTGNGSETYGLLIRNEPRLHLVGWEYISTDAEGRSLEWPKANRRRPIRFRLSYRDQRVFDVVALHAPAPNHENGKEALDAIANLGKIRLDCETIVMGDLNANTEPEERDYFSENKEIPRYKDESFAEQAEQSFQAAMTGWQKKGKEQWIIGSDYGRSSLKKKMTLEGSADGTNAAYDKIWLNTPDVNDACLTPKEDFVVPLLEYFMPEALRKTLPHQIFSEPSPFPFDVKTVQDLLTQVNLLSDHLPVMMILDAAYQPESPFKSFFSLKKLARNPSAWDSVIAAEGFTRGVAATDHLNCLLHTLVQLEQGFSDPDYALRAQVEQMRQNLADIQFVPRQGMIDIGTPELRELIDELGLCVHLHEIINGKLRLIARIGNGRPVHMFWSNNHFEPLWKGV